MAKPKGYIKRGNTDPQTRLIEQAIDRSMRHINQNVLLRGVLLKDISLASGSNTVAHKLGEQPQGWIITDRQGAATVHRTAWDSTELTLSASAAVTVSIWVF